MSRQGVLDQGEHYLAFDTSGAVGSVAVSRGGEVLAYATLDEKFQHAARLVPTIDRVMRAAQLSRADLAGVVVGEGPGSFTGVRVAGATAKGLTHALGVPLWPVSSLGAAALAIDVGPYRYALFDARSDRVYGACYGVGKAGVQVLTEPHGGSLREVLDADLPSGVTFVGEGAHVHRAAIEAAGFGVAADGAATPHAVGLIRYLASSTDFEPVERGGGWEPRYVREWEAKATRAG